MYCLATFPRQTGSVIREIPLQLMFVYTRVLVQRFSKVDESIKYLERLKRRKRPCLKTKAKTRAQNFGLKQGNILLRVTRVHGIPHASSKIGAEDVLPLGFTHALLMKTS